MESKRKIFVLFFGIGLIVSACNKGAVLSHDLEVQFIASQNTTIFPTGAFPHFNTTDPFEVNVYPSYVNYYDSSEINGAFYEDLKAYLKKNKIYLVADSTTYRIKITSVDYSESNNREEYIDSCDFWNPSKYVYYSDLKVTASAQLLMGNLVLDSFTESANSHERVKSARDECNKPEIGSPLLTFDGLRRSAAKKLRARISNKLKEIVG